MAIDARLSFSGAEYAPTLNLSLYSSSACKADWNKTADFPLGVPGIYVLFRKPLGWSPVVYKATYCNLYGKHNVMMGDNASTIIRNAVRYIRTTLATTKAGLLNKIDIDSRLKLCALLGKVTQETDATNYYSGMVDEEQMHHRLMLNGIPENWTEV